MELKNEVKARLINRKDNGWKDFVRAQGASEVQSALVELVNSSLKEGKSPISKDILKSILFDGAPISEADVLFRLK